MVTSAVAAYSEDLSHLAPPPKRRGTGGPSGAIAAIGSDFVAEQQAKALARRERFASAASAPPPPLPTKRIAWAGGKITSNKEEAVARYIERKRQADGLSTDEEQAVSYTHLTLPTICSV